MEMRKLSGTDLYSLINILSKVGAKELVKIYFESVENAKVNNATEEDLNKYGEEFMTKIIEVFLCNLENAKDEINLLLAKLCGVTKSKIDELDLIEYGDLIIRFIKKDELLGFIKCIFASKSMANML